MIYAHIFLEGDLYTMQQMKVAPRVGETIRFKEQVFGVVTEVVWCLDEPSNIGQRVNIRAEKEPSHDNQ